ncbi:MAG: DUF4190 domain-containing protein [Planctomycetes bacterium]|nr:DUF4190 domain-containing protein [Planctomycetota bacterium]
MGAHTCQLGESAMTNLPPSSPAQSAPPPAAPKTCGLAIGSLICGIVGPCTLGLASIAGIILGAVGLSKIGKAGGALRGRGLAIAGIVLGGLGLVALPVIGMMAAFLMPAVHGNVGQARAGAFMNNARIAGQAAIMYAVDHDDAFPPPDDWPQILMEQGGLPSQVLADPSCPEAGRALAMNARLAGRTIDEVQEPSRTVLFFECVAGAPPAGGPELLGPGPRYPGGYVIAFCDGHIEGVQPERVPSLLWDPGRP